MKLLALAFLLLASMSAHARSMGNSTKEKSIKNMDTTLNMLVAEYEGTSIGTENSLPVKPFVDRDNLLVGPNGRPIVDVVGTVASNEELKAVLEGMGATVTGCFSLSEGACSAEIGVESLRAVAEASLIASISANYVQSNVGSVESEASQSMFADLARIAFDVDGKGVKICVMSNSFNTGVGTVTTAEDDVALGDLPPSDRMDILLDNVTTSGSAHKIRDPKSISNKTKSMAWLPPIRPS